jgi:hypothetical protein
MAAKKETPRRVARDARKPSSQGKSSGVGPIGWIVAGVLCLFAVIAGLLFATGKGASKNPEATYVSKWEAIFQSLHLLL